MILCNYRVSAVLLLLIRKYLASFQLPVEAFQLLLSQCLRVQFLVSLGPLKQPFEAVPDEPDVQVVEGDLKV